MGYFIAFLIGGTFGVLVMCFMVAAKDGDEFGEQ
jgi:hypothetical protein